MAVNEARAEELTLENQWVTTWDLYCIGAVWNEVEMAVCEWLQMQEPDIYVRSFKYVGRWDIWAQFITVSHVSLWLSEPYLLSILCATKTFHKYFRVDDDGGGSDIDNQLYTS